MNVPARLAAFALVLGLAFGGAALAGAAIDPTDEDAVVADSGHGGDEPATGASDSRGGKHGEGDVTDGGGEHASSGPALSGLAISQDGFTLEPERTYFNANQKAPFRFQISDDRGRVIRDEYELESERELHLIVARRDTAVYEHLHPRKGQDGTWRVQMPALEPGVYRAFADFQIGGKKRALATDLFVPGDFQPTRVPEPKPVSEVDDFSVAIAAAQPPQEGKATNVVFRINRDGRPFERLERYLGARGHLVALREGDLGYLHVHPEEGAGGNAVAFEATFPTAGRYRLFFQFQTGGRVRTVAYTLEVPR